MPVSFHAKGTDLKHNVFHIAPDSSGHAGEGHATLRALEPEPQSPVPASAHVQALVGQIDKTACQILVALVLLDGLAHVQVICTDDPIQHACNDQLIRIVHHKALDRATCNMQDAASHAGLGSCMPFLNDELAAKRPQKVGTRQHDTPALRRSPACCFLDPLLASREFAFVSAADDPQIIS